MALFRGLFLWVAVLATPAGPTSSAPVEKTQKPPSSAQQPAPQLPRYSETIEVTASRAEQPLLDSPVSLSVISEKQIAASAADNYGDLLRGVAGVNVIQTSARDVCIRARGATHVAENSQIALVDGRSVYLDYYGLVVWDYLPITLDEVKSIEVLRGPGSAIWGANAMSGVINILTKPPKELSGGWLSLRAGERQTRQGAFLWGETRGALSYKISGSFFEQDPWPRDNRLPDGSPLPFGYTYTNRGTRQPKADARLDVELTDSSIVSVRGGYGGTSGIFHSNVGPFLIERGAHVAYAEVDYTRGSTDVKAYLNRLDGDAPNLLNGLQFSFLNNTYAAEATTRHLVGSKNLFIVGGTARSNRFNLSLAPSGRSRNDAGVFVEDIIDVAPWLEINAGVRLDYFDVLGSVTSPRLSVIRKLSPNQAVRIAANRAYRAPTLVENFLDTAVPNVIILSPTQPVFFYSRAVGNRDLRHESLDALELGYSARFQKFYVDAAIYRNTIKNNVTFFPSEFFGPADPPPGWPLPPSTVPLFTLPKTFTFFNVGRVRNDGLELSAEARIGSGTVRASYTHQNAPRVDNENSSIPLVVNRPPRNLASLSGELPLGPWFGSASVSYTDRAFWADVLDSRFWGWTNSYTIVNARAGKHLGERSDLSLEGTNIFNRAVKQHIFGDSIGRKISIELRHRFH